MNSKRLITFFGYGLQILSIVLIGRDIATDAGLNPINLVIGIIGLFIVLFNARRPQTK
jgi:hypothetical protein